MHPVEPGDPAGELDENPAEVPSHVSDPARNPGHSARLSPCGPASPAGP